MPHTITQKICIAGKNSIAIHGMKLVMQNYPNAEIFFLTNTSDNGNDDWQPSFKKYAIAALAKHECRIEEIYEIEDVIFLSLEYDKIIHPKNFKSTELFNIHFSLLPKYRGMYTSAWPILLNEKYSGVTLHKIDNGIDTGDTIAQEKFYIGINSTAKDLYLKYLSHSKILLEKNIRQIISGQYSAKPQNTWRASYFSKKSIDYANLKIDFNKTAIEVHNQFRAFTFPEYQVPSFCSHEIKRSKISDSRSTEKPGTIVDDSPTHFKVATIDFDVILLK